MSPEFRYWVFGVLESARRGKTALEEREGITVQQYVNYYRCPYDGTEWADIWSCCCNDMCPKCETKDIEPYKSEDVIHTAPRKAQ
jgi:hypothetical protein